MNWLHALWLVLMVEGEPRSEDLRAVVELPDSEVTLVVRDRGGGPAHAARFFAAAKKALPILAREIGWPLGRRERIVIEAHDDDAKTGGYGGVNYGRRILILGESSDTDLIHELAHCWFHGAAFEDSSRQDRWLCEGISDWATQRVLRAEPSLGDPVAFERLSLERLTEFERSFGPLAPLSVRQPPYPLPATLEPQAHSGAFYGASHLFLALLEGEVGAPELRRALWRSRLEGRFRSRAFLRELAHAVPTTLGCERGWLDAGTPPEPFRRSALRDEDGDGLRAGLERWLGTLDTEADSDGDGLPDGAEFFVLGSSPSVAEALPGSLHVPFWKEGTLAARPGDAVWDLRADLAPGSPDWADLLAYGARADEHWVYLRFVLAMDLPADSGGVTFMVGFDRDGDDVFDETLYLGGDDRPRLQRLEADGTWGPVRDSHLSELRKGRRSLSLAVPRASLGLSGRVRAFGGSTFLEKGERVFADQLEWLDLELP